MMGVTHHIAVPAPKRDLAWIKSALQLAIELEHATMPPYIAATYSLKVQNFTAYNLMRSVAMEEMVHMAAACNILAALGGTPRIKTLSPTYPSQGLPGGAEPELFVCLAALSKNQLANFMRLEAPMSLVDPKTAGGEYPSISTFYDALRAAIVDNADAVRQAVKAGGKSNQVGDNIGFSVIAASAGDPVTSILKAIDSVTAQGEGVPHGRLHAGPESEKEDSHYARFAQLYFGKQLSVPPGSDDPTPETLSAFFQGYDIPFPEVVNTLTVTLDGYEKVLAVDPDRAAAEKDLLAFDQAYTDMMAGLDDAWNGDPTKWWPTLGQSVTLMAKLRVLGCFNVMRHQVPAAAIKNLQSMYPAEFDGLARYTRLDQPVFYGPRFRNLNAARP